MDDAAPVLTPRLTMPALVRRTPGTEVPVMAALTWSDGSSETCHGWALQWAWFGDGTLPQVRCRLFSVRLERSVTTWTSAANVHRQ